MPFLDKEGLAYFWQQIVARLNGKVEREELDELDSSLTEKLNYGGKPIITTEGDGSAYTATIDGVTALTVGMSFTMVPHTVSTSTSPTLNVNGLGAKTIRRRVSNATSSTAAGYNASWLAANKPIRMEYDGTFWIADLPKSSAADMSGTLKTANGGTGNTDGYIRTGALPSSTIGNRATAEGTSVIASGDYSHAEGMGVNAFGQAAHAEGCSSGQIPDDITPSSTNDEIIAAWTAENDQERFSVAKGNASHVEGTNNLALGHDSHAEGYTTCATGDYSHAEGRASRASGYCAHAEGIDTTASGDSSHSEGIGTIASSHYQHVQGKYSIEDVDGLYAHIVGNGNGYGSRSNAHTLDWDGNAWFAGAIDVEDKATTLANIGAAPAGYGLGGYSTWLGDSVDIDTIVNAGWYAFGQNNTSPNKPYTLGNLFVLARATETTCTQIFSTRSANYSILAIRSMHSGAWGEWEWINPPMQEGVEYRTTERYLNAYPIYTMFTTFGALPNATEKYYQPLPANCWVTDFTGYAINSTTGYSIPLTPGHYGIQYMGSTASSGALWVSTTTDMSSWYGYFVVKYFKA